MGRTPRISLTPMLTLDQDIDVAVDPRQNGMETLNDALSSTDTAKIPLAKVSTPEKQRATVGQRIAAAKKQTGVRVVELFDVLEINELIAHISGEEMRDGQWRIRTHDEATKRLLRSTMLHFTNKIPQSEKIEDVMHNAMPRAVKGDFAELEDRVSRLKLNETLGVRLPPPDRTDVAWKDLMRLRTENGNRVRFLPHSAHSSFDYAGLPIEVELSEAEQRMSRTQEYPSLKPTDPKKVLRSESRNPVSKIIGNAASTVSGWLGGMKKLWERVAHGATKA